MWGLNYAGVPLAGYAHRVEFGGGIVFVVLCEFTRQLGSVPLFLMASFAVLDTAGSFVVYAGLSEIAQSP